MSDDDFDLGIGPMFGPEPFSSETKGKHPMITFKTEREVMLSLEELGMLLVSPYANPHSWSGRGTRSKAKRLVELGLFEQNPDTPHLYRCTEKAEELLAPYLKGRV